MDTINYYCVYRHSCVPVQLYVTTSLFKKSRWGTIVSGHKIVSERSDVRAQSCGHNHAKLGTNMVELWILEMNWSNKTDYKYSRYNLLMTIRHTYRSPFLYVQSLQMMKTLKNWLWTSWNFTQSMERTIYLLSIIIWMVNIIYEGYLKRHYCYNSLEDKMKKTCA